MNGEVGFADLARLIAAEDERGELRVADQLGLELAPPRPDSPPRTFDSGEMTPTALGLDVDVSVEAAEPLPFWRVVRHQSKTVTSDEETSGPEAPTLTLEEIQGRGAHLHRPWPELTPLASWLDLAPLLSVALSAETASRRPDVPRIVRLLADNTPLEDRVPRLPRRSWPAQLDVLVDRRVALEPLFRDQAYVIQRLREEVPRLRVVVFDAEPGDVGIVPGDAEEVPWIADASPAVLALTDLGKVSGGPAVRRAWSRLGERLVTRGHRPVALDPCWYVPTRSRAWTPVTWGRNQDASDAVGGEELLVLCAYLQWIDAGMLRELRALVPAATAATEVRAWCHPSLSLGVLGAPTIDVAERDQFKGAFERLDGHVRERALAIAREWRAHVPREIWMEELLDVSGRPSVFASVPEVERREMTEYFRSVAATAEASGGYGAPVFARWVERIAERIDPRPETQGEAADAVLRAWRRVARDGAKTPSGFDPVRHGKKESSVQRYRLRQERGELRVLEPATKGSWIADFEARDRLATLRAIEVKPAWATRAGEDAYGRWASFEVQGIEQVMRWIPGGAFLMGSPKDEGGRHDDETQHEVTLSEGYWLAETPCTQALWAAVMKSEPSRFKGLQRPVEQVSFDDVQVFLTTLNAQAPRLDFVLPTEAQWERACRAGSDEARYGPLGEVAWFDENSGGETHDVKTRAPNAWGLHDMLGNVLEWCADGADGWGEPDPYPDGPVVDPLAEPRERPGRVMRGGSWFVGAGGVRAACRGAYPRDDLGDLVGFRLARGRAQPSPGPAEPASSSSSAGPRGTRETEPHVIRTVRLDADTRIPIDLRAPVRLETDLVSLDLEPFERPEWASGVGRDRYGLFADVEVETRVVPEVIRMRWIPPGRFIMGSPEDEPGRLDNETQHQVTLTQGYWLADTPCTQALYEAVLGGEANPSRFRTGDRPVESVSWDNAIAFIAALNRQHTELALRLPTQAEWESACRAGTTAATYGGPIEILGERNAPALDTIAWYGGNSGVGYDLEEGHDTSGWNELQHPNPKAGTRPVCGKTPNRRGLYDTLGNVWEWCADGAEERFDPDPSPDGPVEDPLAEPGERPLRVLRGGSWRDGARVVRAAYRHALPRDVRDDCVGFRLARGRAPGGGVPAVEPPEQPERDYIVSERSLDEVILSYLSDDPD
ncbi:MAG: formylglycine-generating enzyme family protein [Deltaproteobacteria bacterium]